MFIPNLSEYINFEINPVKIVYQDIDSQYFDKCEENDPNLYMWSIYGRKPLGIFTVADCLYDFSRKDLAEICLKSLNTILN